MQQTEMEHRAAGGGDPHPNIQPFNTISYLVASSGEFCSGDTGFSELPCVGEIRMFAGGFTPAGYQPADGQLLSVAQNAPLFSYIGTTYGGDGRTTFRLPDLRGRMPIGAGQGEGLTNRRPWGCLAARSS